MLVKNTFPHGTQYLEDAKKILGGDYSFQSTDIKRIDLGIYNDENFIVFKLLIAPIITQPGFQYKFTIEYSIKNSLGKKTLFSWNETEDFNIFPINTQMEINPLLCNKIILTLETNDPNCYFPTIGDIEYIDDLNGIPITDSANIENFTENNSLKVGNRNQEMFSMVLKDTPNQIITVLRNNEQYLTYAGEMSRHAFWINQASYPSISGIYFYDPIDNAIIVKKTDDFDCMIEYTTGIGCKAIVAIAAEQNGPMYDIDKESISMIHPDDIQKLKQDPVIPWNVINSKELQGGYQYFAPEYIDAVQEEFGQNSDPRLDPAYFGRGTKWIKVGNSPDSFEFNESGYRKYWMNEDSNGNILFVTNTWKTKARGYVTFYGPPNSIIPKGIRIIAPAKIKEKNMQTNEEINPFNQSLNLSIPNGGIKPATLSIELEMENDFNHPSSESRKMAVFRPHVMVYMRERTNYLGSTSWKDVGDGFGKNSEQTGSQYWS